MGKMFSFVKESDEQKRKIVPSSSPKENPHAPHLKRCNIKGARQPACTRHNVDGCPEWEK